MSAGNIHLDIRTGNKAAAAAVVVMALSHSVVGVIGLSHCAPGLAGRKASTGRQKRLIGRAMG